VTDLAERIAWQRRAAFVLADLLAQAARDQLPVLAWTVANAGCTLTGQATSRSRRREDLNAWAHALGITVTEYPWLSGASRLSGDGELRRRRQGLVTVRLVADLYEDSSDEEERESEAT
jgi:hypothetical protein